LSGTRSDVTYSTRIKQSAAKALARIDKTERRRLISDIDRLADNPHAGSALKGEFKDLRRLRVGDYRVVYEVRDKQFLILAVRVAHRRQVYR